LGKNVDTAPAPVAKAPAPASTAPAPILLHTKPTFIKQTKVRVIGLGQFFLLIQIITTLNRNSKTLLQFVRFFIEHLCLTSGLEPEPSEPESHHVGAPAPPKLYGS
jgi:hypothetical protein